MKVIMGARGQGKTTRLVAESCTNGSTILVSSQKEIGVVKDVARKMGLIDFLPEPISVTSDSLVGHRGSFLVDNIDIMLPTLLGAEIETITVSSEGSGSCLLSDYRNDYSKLPKLIQEHIDWQVEEGISIGRSIYEAYIGVPSTIHGKKEIDWIVRHETSYIKGYLDKIDMEK